MPTTRRLVIAGITLGYLEEYPLVRSTRVPLKITVLDQSIAALPFDLSQDKYQVFDQATAQYMLTIIEGGLSCIRQRSPQHPPEKTTYQHGLSDHIAYLEEPFNQAAEALRRRLHQFGIPH